MKLSKPILSLVATLLTLSFSMLAMASLESKTRDASDKAKQFVKNTVVIGFLQEYMVRDGPNPSIYMSIYSVPVMLELPGMI